MTFDIINMGELYDIASGLSKSAKEFGQGGSPFLSFKTVFYNYFLPDELSDTVWTSENEQRKCSIKKGDVFLTRTSETMHELGMSSVALKDYPKATFNGFTKRLRLKSIIGEKVVYPKYLAYYLRSYEFRNQISSMSLMSTRASLNNEMINRLTIRLPEYSLQKKIGDLLYLLDEKSKKGKLINENLAA